MSQSPTGWSSIGGAYHFFRNGRSFCYKHRISHPDRIDPKHSDKHVHNCQYCQKKAKQWKAHSTRS